MISRSLHNPLPVIWESVRWPLEAFHDHRGEVNLACGYWALVEPAIVFLISAAVVSLGAGSHPLVQLIWFTFMVVWLGLGAFIALALAYSCNQSDAVESGAEDVDFGLVKLSVTVLWTAAAALLWEQSALLALVTLFGIGCLCFCERTWSGRIAMVAVNVVAGALMIHFTIAYPYVLLLSAGFAAFACFYMEQIPAEQEGMYIELLVRFSAGISGLHTLFMYQHFGALMVILVQSMMLGTVFLWTWRLGSGMLSTAQKAPELRLVEDR